MRDKLFINAIVLAAALAAGGCDRTPSGKSSTDDQSPSRSIAERQTGTTAPEQRGAEQGTHPQATKAPEPAGKTSNRTDTVRNEEQSSAQPRNGNSKVQREEPETHQLDVSTGKSSAQNEGAALQQEHSHPPQTQAEQAQAQQSAPAQNLPPSGGEAATVSSREQIRQVQTKLREKRFYFGRVDGIYGPRTRKALIAFQQQERLQATGQIDASTVAALGVSLGPDQQQSESTGSTTGQSGTAPR